MNTLDDQTLALAGVFQSAIWVEHLAKQGQLPADELALCIRSVLNLNPTSVADVFEGSQNLTQGLTILKQLSGKSNISHAYSNKTLRYAMGLLHIQGKLSHRKDLLNTLSRQLTRSVQQYQHFNDPLHPTIISAVADCYKQSVSQLKQRIRVTGNPQQLKKTQVAEQIRACLLFGIRSSHLWAQLGGRRWHLVFKRNSIHLSAQNLLNRG